MVTLFKNSLYTFHLLNDKQLILVFDWTNNTQTMSYEDFQEACHNYAGFAWQYQVKHLLVDTRNFLFQLPADFTDWRAKELNPRYDQLGVLKFAYLIPLELMEAIKDIPAEMGKFETCNFINFEGAIHWLNN